AEFSDRYFVRLANTGCHLQRTGRDGHGGSAAENTPISRPAEASDWAQRVTRWHGGGGDIMLPSSSNHKATALRMARRREPTSALRTVSLGTVRTSVSSRAASESEPLRPVRPVLFLFSRRRCRRLSSRLGRSKRPRRELPGTNPIQRMGAATTSSYTDAGQEVTANGLKLTGAERAPNISTH
ncbi:hypothetical protein THAOC_30906, partial [Thalassiosira oceanica]